MMALSLLGLGQTVSANNVLNEEYVKIGFGYAGNLQEINEGKEFIESHGYELSAGYFVKDNWLIEAGLSKFGSNNESYPDNMFLRIKDVWSVSDYAAVYIGGGINYFDSDFYPAVNIGLHYDLNQSFYVDAGYQAIFSEDRDNLYSMLVSLNYRLPTANPAVQTAYAPAPHAEQKEPEPVVVAAPVCEPKKYTTYGDYVVIKGDNLTFISRKLERTLDEMIEANPQLTVDKRTIHLIYPDERLHYPVVKETCSEEIEKFYKEYTVVKGDNLTFIARKLNRTLEEMILANPQLALKCNSIDRIYPNEIIFYSAEPNILK